MISIRDLLHRKYYIRVPKKEMIQEILTLDPTISCDIKLFLDLWNKYGEDTCICLSFGSWSHCYSSWYTDNPDFKEVKLWEITEYQENIQKGAMYEIY